ANNQSFSKFDLKPTLKRLSQMKESIEKNPPDLVANITMPPRKTEYDRYADAVVLGLKHAEDVKNYNGASENGGGSLPTTKTFPQPKEIPPSDIVPDTKNPSMSTDNIFMSRHHTTKEVYPGYL